MMVLAMVEAVMVLGFVIGVASLTNESKYSTTVKTPSC